MTENKHNLDGMYFRVERNGKWENICFCDLTDEEIEVISDNRNREWWKHVALNLRRTLNKIADQLEIYAE